MKNIKVVPSKKVAGRVSLQINLNKKGDMGQRGTRKIAYTERFETIEVDGVEYGLLVMLTKKAQ